ncbi:SRPBCC domain-containing protein [Sulfitobacter aestuariivivens]|uniref:SRPBCC domain-containing protein n=1 Tax=Sulfitobacter aestuariivivens TaxID=2766981 RepID=A0A927D2Z9_9RHOB|nr:SRPBCC domain-containing protein [Sulfitobacter aestuariivivens]MBD3664054.1 SRPBCC domain-containing protein [Sulfitobacter aestuariivivens]
MSTDTDTFTYARTYPLPSKRMWHLMTDPTMREKWGVPDDGMVMKVVTSDLRVGGVDHHRCGPADNPEFEVETRWYRLDGPSDAVFTETITAGGARLGASLVTYNIAGDGTGSTVKVTVAVSSFVGPDMIAEFNAGWTGGMESLDRLVATQAEKA